MAKQVQTRRVAKATKRSNPVRFPALQQYLAQHLQDALTSLGKIWRAPIATMLTILVIGIALALPIGMGLLIQNLQQASAGWNGKPQISLFLKKSASKKEIDGFRTQLANRKELEKSEWIDAKQALQDFKASSGFGDALNSLTENPLPNVIVAWPRMSQTNPDQLQKLASELGANPVVELAQLDLAWVQKLNAFTIGLERVTWIITGLLATGVLLTLGNITRMEVQNRREEIEVIKLIGATNGFIRRPFLYTGFWYGTLGGLVSCAILVGAVFFLRGPVDQVANLYHSQFHLQLPGILDTLQLLGASALLGLVGAWISVGHHIKAIEPT